MKGFGKTTLPQSSFTSLRFHVPEEDRGGRSLRRLGEKYPKQAFLFLRARAEFADRAEKEKLAGYYIVPFLLDPWHLALCGEQEFVRAELAQVWENSSANSPHWFALAQILCVSSGEHLPAHVERLIADCRSQEELERAAEIASFDRSTIVFQHPNIVRLFLARANDLGCLLSVRRELQAGARPGARGFTSGEMDESCSYALKLAKEAEAKHHDDPMLKTFYGEIAVAEESIVDAHRRMWQHNE